MSDSTDEQEADSAEDEKEVTGTPPILEMKGHEAALSDDPDSDEVREEQVEQLVPSSEEDSEETNG